MHMGAAFEHPIFDEPNAADPATKPKRFKMAPTFVIDISCSVICIVAILPTWIGAVLHGGRVSVVGMVCMTLILGCYLGKLWIIRHLSRRGGDARTYVKSGELVTDGPYGYSRHPTYALAMLQFLLWSAMAFYFQTWMHWKPLMLAAAVVVPLAFYFVNDMVVMPSEEAMLRRLHPARFDAYAARVNRWFGRRAVRA
jgi:protein-S-isoprenylcysteine O-methyltransferase Ste14